MTKKEKLLEKLAEIERKEQENNELVEHITDNMHYAIAELCKVYTVIDNKEKRQALRKCVKFIVRNLGIAVDIETMESNFNKFAIDIVKQFETESEEVKND